MAASRKKVKETARQAGDGSIASAFKRAAEAARDFGKGAMADMAYRHRDDTHYTVDDDAFEIPATPNRKRIPYTEIKAIRLEAGDKFVFEHDGGVFTIKPVAHLVAGHVKVPIGWKRGATEVPYAMLAEEVAARSGIKIVSS
jgi:hypothetical protein